MEEEVEEVAAGAGAEGVVLGRVGVVAAVEGVSMKEKPKDGAVVAVVVAPSAGTDEGLNLKEAGRMEGWRDTGHIVIVFKDSFTFIQVNLSHAIPSHTACQVSLLSTQSLLLNSSLF